MDRITIENLQVYAHHGVLPEETVLGQRFLVTAVLELETRPAGRTDDLELSVNYAVVSEKITAFLQQNTFRLIESAAEQLAGYLLLEFPLLHGITLTIKKPWAPVGLPLDTVSVSISRQWHTAYVALGSNMGDKESYLNEAVAFLQNEKTIRVQKVSDYLVTKPYGVLDQDDFLNGCLQLQTLLTPQELLELLQQAEQAANRQRLRHWGPRTLDLDILFYDDQMVWEPNLVIPHPEIPKRTFVLEPMVQIAPYFVHPILRKTMRELLETLSAKNTDNQ